MPVQPQGAASFLALVKASVLAPEGQVTSRRPCTGCSPKCWFIAPLSCSKIFGGRGSRLPREGLADDLPRHGGHGLCPASAGLFFDANCSYCARLRVPVLAGAAYALRFRDLS